MDKNWFVAMVDSWVFCCATASNNNCKSCITEKYESLNLYFFGKCMLAVSQPSFDLGNIGNMDESSIYVDCPSAYTYI